MSDDDDTQTEETTEKDENTNEDGQTEKPDLELSDEGKKQVEEMQQAYDDDRPTAVLPGTDNTITGVAVNEWLDDDGNPKFGKDEQDEREQAKDEHGDDDHKDDSAEHEDDHRDDSAEHEDDHKDDSAEHSDDAAEKPKETAS